MQHPQQQSDCWAGDAGVVNASAKSRCCSCRCSCCASSIPISWSSSISTRFSSVPSGADLVLTFPAAPPLPVATILSLGKLPGCCSARFTAPSRAATRDISVGGGGDAAPAECTCCDCMGPAAGDVLPPVGVIVHPTCPGQHCCLQGCCPDPRGNAALQIAQM